MRLAIDRARSIFCSAAHLGIRANCYVTNHLNPDFPLAGLADGLFVGLMGAGIAQIAVLLLTLFLP